MKRVFFFPDFVVCTLCARLRRICRVHAYGFVLVLTAHIKRGGGVAALVERFICKSPRLFSVVFTGSTQRVLKDL